MIKKKRKKNGNLSRVKYEKKKEISAVLSLLCGVYKRLISVLYSVSYSYKQDFSKKLSLACTRVTNSLSSLFGQLLTQTCQVLHGIVIQKCWRETEGWGGRYKDIESGRGYRIGFGRKTLEMNSAKVRIYRDGPLPKITRAELGSMERETS